MNKTVKQEKLDMLKDLASMVNSATMSHDIYGTTKEDAYISGINEGISRAVDLIFEEIQKVELDD